VRGPRTRTPTPGGKAEAMAAFSGAASLALFALALLCQPCLAASDADCAAEEQDESALLQAESALLAHRSASAGADGQAQVANNTDGAVAGKVRCPLLTSPGYITGTSGSICCYGPSGGVILCSPGSTCTTLVPDHPNPGLCLAR